MRLALQPPSGATYARKIEKGEAAIDWASDGLAVARHVNAFSASPGAYAQIPIGGAVERVKLLRAEFVEAEGKPGELLSADMTVACGRGAVRIIAAQRPGKAIVSGRDLIQGARLSIGQTLIVAQRYSDTSATPRSNAMFTFAIRDRARWRQSASELRNRAAIIAAA